MKHKFDAYAKKNADTKAHSFCAIVWNFNGSYTHLKCIWKEIFDIKPNEKQKKKTNGINKMKTKTVMHTFRKKNHNVNSFIGQILYTLGLYVIHPNSCWQRQSAHAVILIIIKKYE